MRLRDSRLIKASLQDAAEQADRMEYYQQAAKSEVALAAPPGQGSTASTNEDTQGEMERFFVGLRIDLTTAKSCKL